VHSCGEALIALLQRYQVELVFGIPGVHTVELYRGLTGSGIRHITPRHEQGAGFMADGYARATGKPGVCLVITGPGMTNIATAMGQALADSIPMLVISSVNHRHQLGLGEGRLHELPNQQQMLAGVTRYSHTLMRADELPQVMARAFAVFNSERPGPVHIAVPLDVMTEPADQLDLSPWPLPTPPGPCQSAIATAARWLDGAQRPLLAIGGGAVAAGAEVAAIAEALGAPVINTVNAKGVLPYSHPLAAGGSASSTAVRDELADADVILAVGTEFAETDYDYYFSGQVSIPGKLIRVDIDPRQLCRNLRPDLAITADASQALTALGRQLRRERPDSSGTGRAATLRESLRAQRNGRYEAFFSALRRALPTLLIAGDSTQPTYYAWLHYETEQPRRYFHSASGYGTLGYAIPAAIGAKLGRPDLPVVGLIGDGAAQFTLGELASAVEAQVPVIFLLWNNAGYGEIRRFMEEADVVPVGVDIHTPDFLALAEAMGCASARANSLAQLEQLLTEAAARSGPSLIEVREADLVDDYPMP
jgi:acetolactate synthase-1/2/3 large subunit